jgi:fructuronate reductase
VDRRQCDVSLHDGRPHRAGDDRRRHWRSGAALGAHDAAPVVAEPYIQWVIEDRFAGARPRWEDAGAELVADVAPFETMKLRLLNGSHSTLAYLGYLAGYDFIWQASSDPEFAKLVERLMTTR